MLRLLILYIALAFILAGYIIIGSLQQTYEPAPGDPYEYSGYATGRY